MTTFFTVLGAVAFVIALPFVVFFCAKLGAFGYLSGKRQFELHYQRGVKANGDENEKTA
jgi:hypothetical protein